MQIQRLRLRHRQTLAGRSRARQHRPCRRSRDRDRAAAAGRARDRGAGLPARQRDGVGAEVDHRDRDPLRREAVGRELADDGQQPVPRLPPDRFAEREAALRVTPARAGYWPTVDLVESWQRGTQPVFVFSSLLAQRRFTAANFAIDMRNRAEAPAAEAAVLPEASADVAATESASTNATGSPATTATRATRSTARSPGWT